MADTTPVYGWPYQEASDPPDGATLGQALAEAIEATVDSIDDRLDTAESAITNNDNNAAAGQATTQTNSFTTAAGTFASVITKSYAFLDEYAYKISYSYRVQVIGGTSPFAVETRLRRASASGTVFHAPGNTAAVATNFMTMSGFCVVKVTNGNTTQTIVVSAAFSSSGAPTSMDLEGASDARHTLLIERLGPAAEFPDALELPTA